MPYHVDLINSLDALDALRDPWQALYDAVPENTGFFSSYSYLRIYLAFHQPPGWTVVAVFDGNPGQLLGVFPLQIFNIQDGARTYRACKPLASAYASYTDFPIRSHCRHAVLSVLLHDILRDHYQCDLAFLGPLHDASPIPLALLESLDAQSLKMVRNPSTVSQIETRGQSLEDYFCHRKSLTLPNARYQARRLSKLGKPKDTHFVLTLAC